MNARPNLRGRKRGALLLAGLLAGPVLFLGGSAQADTPGPAPASTGGISDNNFSISAEGDALGTTISDPSAPLIQTYSASPYGASASMTSLGASSADAGAPYAPIVYGLPSLVNGLGSGGLLPPLPPLPGYTSSSYPGTPSGTETVDGYDISASSTQSDSIGKVSLGSQPPGADHPTLYATAEATQNTDGSVTATATAGADLINFGSLFDIGNLSSTESITVPASGGPKVKSTEDLGTITVLGLKNGLTLDGLNAIGVAEPLPLTASLISTLNALLGASGVSFSYLPQTFTYTDGTTSTGAAAVPSKTLQAVESGALKVTMTENVPSQGVVKVTDVVGRVYVAATNSGGLSSDSAGSSTAGLTDNGGSTVAPPISSGPSESGSTPVGTTGALGVGGPSSDLTGSAPAGNPSTAPLSSPAPSSAGASTPGSSTAPRGQAISRATAVGGPSNESLYLLLVVGAVVAFAGAQIIRLLAVRLTLFSGGRP